LRVVDQARFGGLALNAAQNKPLAANLQKLGIQERGYQLGRRQRTVRMAKSCDSG
jgi:hypothetical protein